MAPRREPGTMDWALPPEAEEPPEIDEQLSYDLRQPGISPIPESPARGFYVPHTTDPEGFQRTTPDPFRPDDADSNPLIDAAEAYLLEFDPELIGADRPRDRPAPAAPPNQEPERYRYLGDVDWESSTDGLPRIRTPDGQILDSLPPGAAIQTETGRVYIENPTSWSRATFLPVAGRQTPGGDVELAPAVPGFIHEVYDIIAKNAERQQFGLEVRPQQRWQEAYTVAGAASTGGFGVGSTVAREGAETLAASGAREATQLGTAGGGSRPRAAPQEPPAPRTDLDPAGFYSHAQRMAETMPRQASGQQAMQHFLGSNNPAREVEIQAMNLDRFLLGAAVADTRRQMLQTQNRVSDYQRALADAKKKLAAREAVGISSITEGAARNEITTLEGALAQSQQNLVSRTKELEQMSQLLPARNFTRREVQDYIDFNRTRTAETVYAMPQYRPEAMEAVAKLAAVTQGGATGLFNRFRSAGLPVREATDAASAVATQLANDPNPAAVGRIMHILQTSLQPVHGLAVRKILDEIAGVPIPKLMRETPIGNTQRTTYNRYTLEPNNPTNREIVLKIDTPETRRASQIIQDIPQTPRVLILANWGKTRQEMTNAGYSPDRMLQIENAYRNFRNEVAALKRLEQQGVFFGPHFINDPNSFSNAMTSIQRLPDGRKVLYVNQLQSDFSNAIEHNTTSARHALASSLNRWVDPTFRRIVKEAVDSEVDGIIIPNGPTVSIYNPLPDQIKDVYNMIYPRRMSTIMREMDKNAGQSSEISGLESFPNVVGRYFPITDSIRSQIRGGQGLRLMSGTGDDARAAAIAGGIEGAAQEARRIARQIPRVDATPARAPAPGSLSGRIRRSSTTMENYPAAYQTEVIRKNDPHPGPVIGYHGTRAVDDFTTFDLSLSKDIGHHFGTKEQANYFTNPSGDMIRVRDRRIPTAREGSRVFPAYIDARNPITLPDLGGWDPKRLMEAIIRRAENDGTLSDSMLADRARDLEVKFSDVIYRRDPARTREAYVEIRSLLDDLGYDSIRYWNSVEGDGYSYIIWKPGMVRSATDPTHQLYSGSVPLGGSNGSSSEE